MKVSQAFPSDYLLPTDIGNRDVTVTVETVELKKVGRDNQYVCYFEGKRKGLILYQKQARQISSALADDEMDNWRGRQITLYVGQSDNGKDYIYVKEASAIDERRYQAPAPARQAPPPPTPGLVDESDIPF
jgi:hypothetical protein